MAEPLDNITFVQEVEKHPVLYDFRLPEYMRRDATEKAWEEIGSRFQLSGPDCKERWKNLRSVFVRQLKAPKTASARPQKKPYYLTEYMQFTVPFIKLTSTDKSGNLQTQKNEHIYIDIEPETESNEYILSSSSQATMELDSGTSLSQSESTLTLDQSTNLDLKPKLSFNSSACQPILSDTDPLSPKKIKRKKNEELNLAEDITDYLKLKRAKQDENLEEAEQSSSKMFLLSLLSDMNKMNNKQRRVFKRKVLCLVDVILDEDSDRMQSS